MTAQEDRILTEIERLNSLCPSLEPGAAREAASDIEIALTNIGELASSSHPEAASVATELLEQFRGSRGENSDSILKAGLVRLQESMRGGSEAEQCPANATEPQTQNTDTDSLGDDPELISDFVIEAREHLLSIETKLLALEKDPALADAVHSVFRSFHTIKGLTGFLGLKPIHEVAHETETILDHAREKRIPIDARLIDIALKAADYIRVAVDALSSSPARQAMQTLGSNAALLIEIASAAHCNAPRSHRRSKDQKRFRQRLQPSRLPTPR